jgi:hypothetical protein
MARETTEPGRQVASVGGQNSYWQPGQTPGELDVRAFIVMRYFKVLSGLLIAVLSQLTYQRVIVDIKLSPTSSRRSGHTPTQPFNASRKTSPASRHYQSNSQPLFNQESTATVKSTRVASHQSHTLLPGHPRLPESNHHHSTQSS